MSILLEAIVTGMNGGPEAIQQNFNTVKNEMERMDGSVVDIPKEQFTPINGFTVDSNSCYCRIYKFNSFAIITVGVFVGGVTMKAWSEKETVTIPKSYLNGFSKFQYFGDRRQSTDDNWTYESKFDVTKGSLSIYSRGHDFNSAGLAITVAGVLYN